MSEFTKWDAELYHHGILGQKWGVRRFQNADGTWTAAGKKRKQRMEDMTDAELKSHVERLRLENEYRKLNTTKFGRAVDYVRAFNKERAENRQKKAQLLSAKAALRQANPLLRGTTKLMEGLGDAGGKFAQKVIGEIGDTAANIVHVNKETVQKGKDFVSDQVKKTPERGKKASTKVKEAYKTAGEMVLDERYKRSKNKSAWAW